MKSLKKIASVFLVNILIASCTEPIGIEGTDNSIGLLVVEGFISTESKKHTIRLTETARYGSIFEQGGFIEGVEEALLLVRDDLGKVFEFSDLGNGYYESRRRFGAEIGRSYSLLVDLADGRSFLSLPVQVTPVVSIDSLEYQYAEVLDSEESDARTGFRVTAVFDDPEENGDFYLWQAEGLYELNTFPELHEIIDNSGLFPVIVPDPKECCRTCWHRETLQELEFTSDNLFNGNQTERAVAFIEDNGLRFFNEKYQVKIRQYGVDRQVFDFYSQLFGLFDLDGDIFDPPPLSLRGNIINTVDPSETAIGYFWAADVAIDSIFLDSNELLTKKPQPVVKDDCRETPGTSTIEPIYWNID